MTTHEDFESLLGAYALDAVEPEEAALVEAHLAECPRCRAEIDRHREVAGAIGNSVEPLPPELWDRIAGQLSRPSTRPVEPRLAPSPPSPAGAPEAPPAPVVPLDPAARRRRPAGRRVAVAAVLGAAAVAVIVFLSVGLVHANNQVTQLRSASGSLSAAASAARANPANRQVVLHSPTGQPVATAVILPDGHAYLTDITMPALPGGRTYQLWGVIGGRPISLSLLGQDPRQAGFSIGSARPSELAVTDEPSGGSVAPSGSPVASAPLTST